MCRDGDCADWVAMLTAGYVAAAERTGEVSYTLVEAHQGSYCMFTDPSNTAPAHFCRCVGWPRGVGGGVERGGEGAMWRGRWSEEFRYIGSLKAWPTSGAAGWGGWNRFSFDSP